jgi:hypothetical protein
MKLSKNIDSEFGKFPDFAAVGFECGFSLTAHLFLLQLRKFGEKWKRESIHAIPNPYIGKKIHVLAVLGFLQ